MKDLAKVNDYVVYNGEIGEHVSFMVRGCLDLFFKVGATYKVREFYASNGNAYYRFYGFNSRYPVESFEKCNMMAAKYGLR